VRLGDVCSNRVLMFATRTLIRTVSRSRVWEGALAVGRGGWEEYAVSLVTYKMLLANRNVQYHTGLGYVVCGNADTISNLLAY
jgi:hypothetical protein